MIVNPMTGRLIKVGGSTYNTVFGGNTSRSGGALMVDREMWLRRLRPRKTIKVVKPRKPKPVTARKRLIVLKSMLSHNETVHKGAMRSLTGKYKTRPSPSMSATLFTVGTRERGNDGRMWKIIETRNGVRRWTPA
jgi:hypothetical protein